MARETVANLWRPVKVEGVRIVPRRRTDDQQTDRDGKGFPGFDHPTANYYRMPNNWTDITAEINNIAELKVVEYILRHTWGYQEYGIKKHITIDEFVRGRRRQDGTRMDKGTGLSERAVRYGLQNALKDQLIEEAVDDSDRARVKKYYSLRMKDTAAENPAHRQKEGGGQDLQSGVQTLHPGVQSLPPRGAKAAPRSEKETKERHFKEMSSTRKDPSTKEGQERTHPAPDTPGQSASPGLEAIGTTPQRRRGRSPGSGTEEREVLRAYLADYARELNDQATLTASISRAYNLYQQSKLDLGTFIGRLQEARSITQERTAAIQTRSGQSTGSFASKAKMAYWFAVVEDLLHLTTVREDPSLRH